MIAALTTTTVSQRVRRVLTNSVALAAAMLIGGAVSGTAAAPADAAECRATATVIGWDGNVIGWHGNVIGWDGNVIGWDGSACHSGTTGV